MEESTEKENIVKQEDHAEDTGKSSPSETIFLHRPRPKDEAIWEEDVSSVSFEFNISGYISAKAIYRYISCVSLNRQLQNILLSQESLGWL